MSTEIEVQWKVDPWEGDDTHTFTVSAEDVEGYDTPEQAIKQVIEKMARQEFLSTIRWCFDNHDELLAQVREAIEARKARDKEEA